MKIVDEVKKKKEADKFYRDFLDFIKEKWKPEKVRDDYGYNTNIIRLYKKGRFFHKKIAVMAIDNYEKTIKVEVLDGYENYNNFRNLLKEFERIRKGVKITLFIKDYLY